VNPVGAGVLRLPLRQPAAERPGGIHLAPFPAGLDARAAAAPD